MGFLCPLKFFPLVSSLTPNLQPLLMTFPTGKRTAVLTYPGTNIVPMPIETGVWPECPIVKDSFWAIVMSYPWTLLLLSRAWKRTRTMLTRLYLEIIRRVRVLLSTLDLF